MKTSEYLIIKIVMGTILALRKGLGVLAGQAGYSLDAFATNSLWLGGRRGKLLTKLKHVQYGTILQ